ncbi:MAG TPA: glycosyltransferase family 4 protein, partial [Burkholderiales bacterium]|nr:glycosyltransferase family 4 protein [Burkholderiales bacterium]
PWVVVTRRPAVIQIQASDFQAFWEAALYVAMGKALRRPLVVRIGGSFDRFYLASGGCARAVIRWVLRQPAVLLVQSQYWKAFVAQLGRAADVSILPNFVKESLIVPRTSTAPAKLRFLLCSGEVPRLKGAYVLLDAMRQLAARGVAADVRIMAATGPLRRAIEDAGLGERVTALDFMEHDEALAALRDTDVFLQISTSEGFPNALLEAMALGCAAIVTPVGAIPEIVGDDGGCAFVIPVGDVRGLAEAMETLVHDRPMVARMAQAAQQRVLARYTESAVISVLDDAWRRARRQRCALATLTEHGLR